jgi:hypothetical protein
MTPDELPADMEALVHALDTVEKIGMTHEDVRIAAPLFDAVNRSRDLLKAYQEQRRALERIVNAADAGITKRHIRDYAAEALNQKGDER